MTVDFQLAMKCLERESPHLFEAPISSDDGEMAEELDSYWRFIMALNHLESKGIVEITHDHQEGEIWVKLFEPVKSSCDQQECSMPFYVLFSEWRQRKKAHSAFDISHSANP